MAALALKQAALELGIADATLRRWLREGCPCESPGSAGRGHGALVDLDAVRRWRGSQLGAGESEHGKLLEPVAVALWDTLVRDGGEGVPLHRSIGITRAQAAVMLAAAFDRIARQVTGQDAARLPAQIERIRSVCITSARSNTGDATK